MHISMNLEEGSTYCALDFEQSDIENMWNYLMADRENFEYSILQYLNNNIDNYGQEWKEDLGFKNLYINLKNLFNDEKI